MIMYEFSSQLGTTCSMKCTSGIWISTFEFGSIYWNPDIFGFDLSACDFYVWYVSLYSRYSFCLSCESYGSEFIWGCPRRKQWMSLLKYSTGKWGWRSVWYRFTDEFSENLYDSYLDSWYGNRCMFWRDCSNLWKQTRKSALASDPGMKLYCHNKTNACL